MVKSALQSGDVLTQNGLKKVLAGK